MNTVKIAVTVCDCSHVVHAGGDAHRVTSIIELPDEHVPENLRRYLKDAARAEEHARTRGGGAHTYQSVTLSLAE